MRIPPLRFPFVHYRYLYYGLLCCSSLTHATNGYFMHGYGVKTQANAGVSTALFQDSMTIANNPAGLSWLATRLDLGATLFVPTRDAEIQGNAAGADGHYDGNARQYFLLPELAYNHHLSDQVALGVAVYGNGGMNSSYSNNPYAAFGNQGSAGVNLSQVFVSPAVAWRYQPQQSIGIAANVLYQRFEAKGLEGFAGFSTDPQHLSNQGADHATGIGLRVGWAAHVLDERLTLGASYASKIKATRFKRYQGLFAEQGRFDVPENFSLGVAYQVTPRLNLAADFQYIAYSDIAAIANRFDVADLQQGQLFGHGQGPGFAWQDSKIYKIALNYQLSPKLRVAAGYSHSNQVIPSGQTFLNILAPAVVQDHLSVGATWQFDPHQQFSVAYTHAFSQRLKGQQSIATPFAGGEADLKMQQHILGVAYAYQF
ncbi:OmpP1/FadL family transporter [Acinetobacter larvae]|uniref:Long-chain fatty acid transporter n=1 Tax=Acinetobacter larvae TaxID=1789224 RepID=A0A1B2LWJ3_9GAMM|nr:outer membrane protein transport protein [Acinetobacter larvae]AOA57133.1 long-chain fatty acid transporter [Acinetobacter larvae]